MAHGTEADLGPAHSEDTPSERQFDFLIASSLHGLHLLFSNESIRSVYSRTPEQIMTEEEASEVEPWLDELVRSPTLETKLQLLNQLDQSTFDAVVRTYFYIVENYIQHHLNVRH